MSSSLLFATDSPVLGPTAPAATPFSALAGALQEVGSREGRLVVLGHASRVGTASHNEALAQARAETTSAWIRRDASVWVDLVAEFGSPADTQRWLAHWARTLGWEVDPGRVDGTIDTTTQRAVAQFQREYARRFGEELEVDGRITRATLAAVFAVSLHELDAHLRDAGVASEAAAPLSTEDVLGCGTSFCDNPTLLERFGEALEEQQRVDVVVVPPECRWTHEHGAQALMLHTLHTPTPEFGLAPRANRLEVRLTDRHGRALEGARYRLYADDEHGSVRAGVTGEDGRLVEADVLGKRLRLELESGAVLVFDHDYARRVGAGAFDREGAIDEDPDFDPFPDEPLPALFDDDDFQDDC